MSKKLSERDKLGIEILKDLDFIRDKIEEKQVILDEDTIRVFYNLSTKVKNLTLKY